MVVQVERVGGSVCQVGESPLWSPAARALYWIDIEGRALHRWRDGQDRRWSLPGRPGCIALAADTGLVCALEDQIVRLGPDDALEALAPEVPALARTPHGTPGMRLNDGRCDRQGRLWVGSMLTNMAQAARVGVLYRLDAGAPSAHRSLDQLIVPNGLAFSPRGDVLYLSDSHPTVRAIWAFDMDADGGIDSRRVFVDMRSQRGRPDGAAVDVDGCYWTCANDGGCLLRFTPEGHLDRTIELPVGKPSMCAFGGDRLDELYVTSIRPASGADALAGATFVCRPGVQGLAETPFGGNAAKPDRRPVAAPSPT